MASYFDAQPPSKATSELLGAHSENVLGKDTILSPQVTSILDGLKDHSSSSSDEDDSPSNSHSEPQEVNAKDATSKQKVQDLKTLHESRTSPLRPKHSPRDSFKKSSKSKGIGDPSIRHPHLARFHSLRSMLFSSHIEENMSKCREEEAEAKWREEYDQRRGLTRPKTPESSPPREGLKQRLGSRLRRATSKEAPSMTSIKENDNESTASSDDEATYDVEMAKKHDERLVSDDESINHSDVEDLVRWVSRRDPPSDGEAAKKAKAGALTAEETETQNESKTDRHDSLGHSDVEDLVRWVSRKSEPEEEEKRLPPDYDEASTESDIEETSSNNNENLAGQDLSDADTDELVRWVSRRDGALAGPVKQKKVLDMKNDGSTSELKRWITKTDETSGESDAEGDTDTELSISEMPFEQVQNKSSPSPKQPRTSRPPLKETLTHEDVDDLVKWVSQRRDSGQVDENSPEKPASKLMEVR